MGEAYVNGYVEGRKLVLLSRGEDGRLLERRVPAEWVAYFRAGELPPALRRQLEGARSVSAVKPEGDWLRVNFVDGDARHWICSDRERRDRETGRAILSPLKKHGVPHYEADVSPVTRYFTDTGAAIQRPRRCYLDIETDSRLPFSRKEEMRVLCWAVCDDQRELACGVLGEWSEAAERALLEELWEALRPYDQVASWNGDGFDFPVIFARSDACNVRGVNAAKWLWIDQMVAFRRMNMHAAESGDEKRSMSLQSIAMATLGRGKKKFDASQTYQAWEAGGARRREMVAYCSEDSLLMPDIERETGYLDTFQTICEVCHLFPSTASLNPTRQLDGYLLRQAYVRGHHFPSRAYYEGSENEEQFKGAFVMKPKVLDEAWRRQQGMRDGILRDVHVADFGSMYPNIIITWNMSPETKAAIPVNGPIPEGHARCPKTGTGFRTDVAGFLAEAEVQLLAMRKQWKDKEASFPPGTPEAQAAKRLSNAYKVCANSFFGVTGNKYSRFHDRQIAEGITQNGAWLIEQTAAEAERRGWVVVYGDTDSIFVIGPTDDEFREFTKWCNAELYPRIIKAQGCAVNTTKIGYEKKFSLLVMTAAKRYIGVFAHKNGVAAKKDSKPEIKGLEFNRGDCTVLGARLQREAVRLLMQGVTAPEAYHDLLSQARTHALEDPLPLEEISLSKSLGKEGGLKGYVQKKKMDGTDAAMPAHVMVARVLEKRGRDVSEGTRVEYVVVDAVAEDPAKRYIPAEDYAGECDRHYVWETLVYPPTERLLAAAFPEQAKQWEAWSRSRPPKPRRGREVLPGQAALFALDETPVSSRPALPMPSRPPAA
jgi:DNA polymerase I